MPVALARGQEFHRRLAQSWRQRHGGVGDARIEQELRRIVGRRGRPDISVDIERRGVDGSEVLFVALLEAKSRDFPRLSAASGRRLVARDRRQILRYVEMLEVAGLADGAPGEVSIAASMVYERGPVEADQRAAIEAYFDEYGVGVIWEDESVDQARQRLAVARA